MTQRDYQEITILIPGYSIEDLPTDLNENSAASLLNAFAVAWHPALLVRSQNIPQIRQADGTDLPTGQQLVLVPECSEDWLGHDWETQLADTLSVVFSNASSRPEWLAQIDRHFGSDGEIADELLQDFLALGTCYLQVMLLSRRMHYFVDPDNHVLESEATAAADAAVAGESDKCRDHLRRCFECLQECREQFQPLDCYLIDVCLPSDQTTAEELKQLVASTAPLTLVISGKELREHCDESKEFLSELSDALAAENVSLMSGHHHELRSSLASLGTLYSDIDEAQSWLQTVCPNSDIHWARRRFGMTSAFPAVLSLFGFKSALHVALDDGLYPDREQGQMRWQGPDSTTIPATSRIPMAIDGASAFQRFADRFTESMQEDSVPVMLLARLPELQSPWLQDLKAAAAYGPVLGKFVTMSEFVDLTENQAGVSQHDEGEYLSPYLIQASVLKTEAPISSPAALFAARVRLQELAALVGLAAILNPVHDQPFDIESSERKLNAEEASRLSFESRADADTQQQSLAKVTDKITADQGKAAETFVGLLNGNAAEVSGMCLVNTLPWKRKILTPWPKDLQPPTATNAVVEAREQDEQLYLLTHVPACGFTWLTESDQTRAVRPVPSKGKPLAEGMLLRNEFYEVQLSESTGGISSVTFHNQRENRVSQQVAFRYENSKTITVDDENITTSYATPKFVDTRVLATGPATAAVETTCDITDAGGDELLARFRQTVSLERSSTRLRIQIVFDEVAKPPVGNPWMAYFASRFAWDNEAAAITRSVLGQARGFRMERFESPDYVEVADADSRLVIVPHGRPYHRRSGHRMLDSLLLVEGETEQHFEFTLDFNHPYPMRVASEAMSPVLHQSTSGQRPAKADSSWVLGLSAKNITIARSQVDRDARGQSDSDDGGTRLSLLLEETEGRAAHCAIHTARKPKRARLRRPNGETVQDLTVTDAGVAVEFSRFQIKEVELTF